MAWAVELKPRGRAWTHQRRAAELLWHGHTSLPWCPQHGVTGDPLETAFRAGEAGPQAHGDSRLPHRKRESRACSSRDSVEHAAHRSGPLSWAWEVPTGQSSPVTGLLSQTGGCILESGLALPFNGWCLTSKWIFWLTIFFSYMLKWYLFIVENVVEFRKL